MVRIHCVLNIFHGRIKISPNFAAVFIPCFVCCTMLRLLFHASFVIPCFVCYVMLRLLCDALFVIPCFVRYAMLLQECYWCHFCHFWYQNQFCLRISLVIFSSTLTTNKRFHVVLPSLPETHLA